MTNTNDMDDKMRTKRHGWLRNLLFVIATGLILMSDEAIAIEQAEHAYGLDNPTLSYNLTGVADYEQSMQFLNLMDMARPWIGHLDGAWGG